MVHSTKINHQFFSIFFFKYINTKKLAAKVLLFFDICKQNE